jgi:hypothetical protein
MRNYELISGGAGLRAPRALPGMRLRDRHLLF